MPGANPRECWSQIPQHQGPTLPRHIQHLPTDPGCASCTSAHPCSCPLPSWGPVSKAASRPHTLPALFPAFQRHLLSRALTARQCQIPPRCQGMGPAEAAMALSPWSSIHRLEPTSPGGIPCVTLHGYGTAAHSVALKNTMKTSCSHFCSLKAEPGHSGGLRSPISCTPLWARFSQQADVCVVSMNAICWRNYFSLNVLKGAEGHLCSCLCMARKETS